MMPADPSTKRGSTAKLGCLTFVAGGILGFIAALMWSNSHVHMLGSHVLRGENRARMVFAEASLGGILGGFVVSGIAVVRRKLNDRRRSSTEQEE